MELTKAEHGYRKEILQRLHRSRSIFWDHAIIGFTRRNWLPTSRDAERILEFMTVAGELEIIEGGKTLKNTDKGRLQYLFERDGIIPDCPHYEFWKQIPEGFFTKTRLAEMGRRPFNLKKPDAKVYKKFDWSWIPLFKLENSVEKISTTKN